MRFAPMLLGLVLSLGLGAQAPTTAQPQVPTLAQVPGRPMGHFLDLEALDLGRLLPEPPAPGSLAAQADLEAVLQAQAWRSPEQQAWAKRVDTGTVYLAGEPLGHWFQRGALPVFDAFFEKVYADARILSSRSKKRFARLRPPKVETLVKPCVPVPTSGSYPSGHSFHAFVAALVLAEIHPENREDLLELAHRSAWSRVLGGVHFPTDVVGGRLLAETLVAEMKKDPAFQAGVQACREEAARLKTKKAA